MILVKTDKNTMNTMCLLIKLPVVQVCLGAHLCQVHRVVPHALELCRTQIGRVRGDQGVPGARVDRENPVGK